MTDVIIIGGGPGGSATGCYLSKAGISNTIIESAIHPRPHVGESLVSCTTRIFDELGFLQTMEDEGFVRKFGATWHAPANQDKLAIEFKEVPQPGVHQDHTYHVDRSKFDLELLKHAENLGSKVYEGVHVKEVLFENDAVCGVRISMEGQEVDLPCKMVVDASGRNTLLGRQLRLKKKDPLFNQYAVHAWFKNVDKGDDKSRDHIHIYFLPVERGWVWQIPITEEITSIGVVAEKDVFKNSKKDLDDYFFSHVRSNENLAEALSKAEQVNEFKTEGDYSYSMTKFAGNGFVMVGDAARFVDPIFSSGVSVALYSAKFASEAITQAVKESDFSAAMFNDYEEKLRDGVAVWYEFIRLYYKLLPLFTYFIQKKDYRLQVLQLLQGEVFDRQEVPVLDAMRKFINTVENSDNHMLKGQLTDIPIENLDDALIDH